MKKIARILLIASVVLSVQPARSEAPREIGWEDLVPALEPLADPFAGLPSDVVVSLHGIISIRAQKAQGIISSVSRLYEIGVEDEHKLEQAGFDVEALIKKYEQSEAEVRRRDQLVVDSLDGKLVKMPGFALPLEFEGTKVQEFLLVPFIGACIHVPPPPPNQMVFVKLSEPFVVKDIYTPVWIKGRVSVKRTNTSFYLTDGTRSVLSGYTVQGAEVEPYKQE